MMDHRVAHATRGGSRGPEFLPAGDYGGPDFKDFSLGEREIGQSGTPPETRPVRIGGRELDWGRDSASQGRHLAIWETLTTHRILGDPASWRRDVGWLRLALLCGFNAPPTLLRTTSVSLQWLAGVPHTLAMLSRSKIWLRSRLVSPQGTIGGGG